MSKQGIENYYKSLSNTATEGFKRINDRLKADPDYEQARALGARARERHVMKRGFNK